MGLISSSKCNFFQEPVCKRYELVSPYLISIHGWPCAPVFPESALSAITQPTSSGWRKVPHIYKAIYDSFLAILSQILLFDGKKDKTVYDIR